MTAPTLRPEDRLRPVEGLEWPARPDSDSAVVSTPGGRHYALSKDALDLLRLVDGRRSVADLAAEYRLPGKEPLSVPAMAELLQQRFLEPGLVWLQEMPRDRPPKGPVWIRLPLLPAPWVAVLAAPWKRLTRGPVAMAAGLVAMWIHLWVYAGWWGPGWPGLPDQLLDPGLWMALAALGWAGMWFHEIGHAATLLAAGERPGSLGLGMYWMIPVAYADVSRAWRLPKWERVRVDLGGIWFQFLFAALLLGLYTWTGNPLFLWAAFLADLGLIDNLDPFLRMDGYWLINDLWGRRDIAKEAQALWLQSWRRKRWPVKAGDRALLLFAVLRILFFLGLGIWATLFFLPPIWAEWRQAWDHLHANPISAWRWHDLFAFASGIFLLFAAAGSLLFAIHRWGRKPKSFA